MQLRRLVAGVGCLLLLGCTTATDGADEDRGTAGDPLALGTTTTVGAHELTATEVIMGTVRPAGWSEDEGVSDRLPAEARSVLVRFEGRYHGDGGTVLDARLVFRDDDLRLYGHWSEQDEALEGECPIGTLIGRSESPTGFHADDEFEDGQEWELDWCTWLPTDLAPGVTALQVMPAAADASEAAFWTFTEES